MNIDFKKYFKEPRNERELCELFSELLFMRVEEFDFGLSSDKFREKMKLTAKGEQLLIDQHILNRIFRCWYQLTWLNEEWSDSFSGATPRQELSAFNEDIGTGEAMLSVSIEKLNVSPYLNQGVGGERLVVVPKLFKREVLVKEGGAFMYGIQELSKNPNSATVAPNYDSGFRLFAEKMQKEKAMAESLHSYTLNDYPDGLVYWRLFIEDAVSAILAGLPIRFSEKQLFEIHNEFSTLIFGFAGMQKNGEIQYVSVDKLFGCFWSALSKADNSLIPFEETAIDEDERNIQKKMKNKTYRYSQIILHLLGSLFDEKFLFPADHYFNAVEIVWQGKMTFMESLALLYELLNNNLKVPKLFNKMNSQDRELFEKGGVNRIYDIKRLWFNPPTCFRFYPWALNIVSE